MGFSCLPAELVFSKQNFSRTGKKEPQTCHILQPLLARYDKVCLQDTPCIYSITP
jgi:hypothetical protein